MGDDRGGSAPPPYRVILPVAPAVEDAAARAAELVGQAATIHALLAPTAQQGRDGDVARLVYGRCALELGTALVDAQRLDEGIPHLEGAATIVEIVVGHHPGEAESLRVAGQSVAALAEALTLLGRPAEAWEWAARSVAVPTQLADATPGDAEGPLLASRLYATLAGLSLGRTSPPPAYLADLRAPGHLLVAVEAFHALLAEAVDHAREAVRRAPDDPAAQHQLLQEAWNLALYLWPRPGLPGEDAAHYGRLVLAAGAHLTDEEPWATACAPALTWARSRIDPA